MAKGIVLLDADYQKNNQLGDFLKKQQYRLVVKKTMAELNYYLKNYKGPVILINSDTVAVTNRSLKELKNSYPEQNILIMSQRPFHPELKEAIGSYVYACLSIPVEPDELDYLLKSITENEVDSKQRTNR
ncbi:MAG: hypothetical protein H8E17_16015 [Deltaproteobacteria bacterium]|nr:hypothetical protein [Deltaproteobacteria bacterium]